LFFYFIVAVIFPWKKISSFDKVAQFYNSSLAITLFFKLLLVYMIGRSVNLEALSVDDGGTRLVVFFLGDPHLLEGGERGKDGSTNPDRVLSLWGSNDLDLHGGRSKSSQFLLHAVSNSREHGVSSRQDNVSVQVLTDVNITLHDGVVGGFVKTSSFHSEEGWLEHSLRASESLVANGDDLSVRQFVGLLKSRGGSSSLHLSLEVKSNVAKLLLDVTDNFTLSSGGEGVATLSQDFHHVVSHITSSKIKTEDGMGKSISFVDGDSVGDTITRVHNNSGGTSRSVEGEHSLDGNVHGWGVEGLEHDLGHLLSVGLRIQWGLSEQDRVLLRGNTELVVESVMPDLFHIVPVGDNTVFNGVLKGQDSSLGLGFITNVGVLLSHTNHDTSVSGSSNNGREDGTWGVITSKASFAHSRTIVNDKSLNVVVDHLDRSFQLFARKSLLF